MTQLQHNSKDFQVRKTKEIQLNNKLIDLQSFYKKLPPKIFKCFINHPLFFASSAGRLTSFKASFVRCFTFSKTSGGNVFFSKHRIVKQKVRCLYTMF